MKGGSQPTRYVVGADGGNSKTDLVLATDQGEVLARVHGEGTRPHIEGMTAMARSLAGLAQRSLAAAGLPPHARLSVAAFHLANVDLPDEETWARDELLRQRVAQSVEVRNNVFAVLRAGSMREWGIAVVVGAGINALGIDPGGRVARFLALGEVSGDWGGGSAVGVSGLGAAVRAGDGRGPHTSLRERIAAHFGGADPEAVAIALHRQEIPDRALHDLAPVVLGAAVDGDAVARAIVERLADEAVSFASAALGRLDLLRSDADVVLGGGLLQSGNRVLLGRIDERLHAVAPDVVLRVLDVPPVAGALLAALALAGASAEAQERARRSLVRR